MTPDLSLYADDLNGQPQPLLDRHVPVITSMYPRFCYVTAVVVSHPGITPGYGDSYVMPDAAELEMIASYHDEYVDHYYGDPAYGWISRQREKHPFDIDGGANGRFLAKRGDGDWLFRRSIWDEVIPHYQEQPHSLMEILNRANSLTDRWNKWVESHPEVFTA